MATHSRILAWKVPWTEEPGGLQSMGSQRVRHDGSDHIHPSFLASSGIASLGSALCRFWVVGVILHTTGCLAESPTPLMRCHPVTTNGSVSRYCQMSLLGYKVTLVENHCCKCSNGNPEFAPYRFVTIE